LAAEIAIADRSERRAKWLAYRDEVIEGLRELEPVQNGDPERTLPTTLNISIPGVDSEAVMVALKDLVAISNGAACTSSDYSPSHVLVAMGLDEDRIAGALRFSWWQHSAEVDWSGVRRTLLPLR